MMLGTTRRTRNAARLLDEIEPGWHRLVPPGRVVDVTNPRTCPLHYVFGDRVEGRLRVITHLLSVGRGHHWIRRHRHVFDPFPNTSIHKLVKINVYWAREIAARRLRDARVDPYPLDKGA